MKAAVVWLLLAATPLAAQVSTNRDALLMMILLWLAGPESPNEINSSELSPGDIATLRNIAGKFKTTYLDISARIGEAKGTSDARPFPEAIRAKLDALLVEGSVELDKTRADIRTTLGPDADARVMKLGLETASMIVFEQTCAGSKFYVASSLAVSGDPEWVNGLLLVGGFAPCRFEIEQTLTSPNGRLERTLSSRPALGIAAVQARMPVLLEDGTYRMNHRITADEVVEGREIKPRQASVGPFLRFQSVEWSPAVLVNEKKAELRLKLLASQNCLGMAEFQAFVYLRGSTPDAQFTPITRIQAKIRSGVANEHVVPFALTKGSAQRVFAQIMPFMPPPLCHFASSTPLTAELPIGAQ